MSFRRREPIVAAVVLVALWAASTRADALDAAIADALVRVERLAEDPFLLPAPVAVDESEVADRRRLAIARSVSMLTSQTDTTITVLEGDVLTMLSLARNTRHLGLRARALRLYDLAAVADREHEYVQDINQERLQCAIELGDSATVTNLAFDLVGRRDAAAYGSSFEAALRYLVAMPAIGGAVRRLVDRVAEIDGLTHPGARIVLAQSRLALGEPAAASRIYADLLLRQRELDDHQVSVCLMGLADATLASGDAATATRLYRTYRDHDAGLVSAWSTYQLGNLAANAARFDEAVALLRSICEREEPTPWRETACVRLAQVRELAAIEAELRPFGRDLRPQRESR